MIKKIKKIMACIMSVCMFMSIICTENISTAKGAESTTVYFLATSEWWEVNAYVVQVNLIRKYPRWNTALPGYYNKYDFNGEQLYDGK